MSNPNPDAKPQTEHKEETIDDLFEAVRSYPTTRASWALWCAENGFAVFPLKPGTKEPATKNGFHDAVKDTATIKQWFAAMPNCNYGVSLGDESNLVVFDIDQATPQEFAELNLPETLTVRSGREQTSGFVPGVHRYYRGSCATRSLFTTPVEPITQKQAVDKWTGEPVFQKDGSPKMLSFDKYNRQISKNRVKIGEVRSRGAYVVGIGSRHPSGTYYEVWKDLPLKESPEQNQEPVRESGNAVPSENLDVVADYIEAGFDESQIDYSQRHAYSGGYKWLVDCPWIHEHENQGRVSEGNSSTAVFLSADGKIGFACKHAHCEERQWRIEEGKESLRGWMEAEVGHKLRFQDEPELFVGGLLYGSKEFDEWVKGIATSTTPATNGGLESSPEKDEPSSIHDLIIQLQLAGKTPDEIYVESGFKALVDESIKNTEAETAKAEAVKKETEKPIVTVSGDDFMAEHIQPRKVLISTISANEPVIFEQSINQIFAWRGEGKTCLGLGFVRALATGGRFLNFKASERSYVLYVEGELPDSQFQERWRAIVGKTDGWAFMASLDKQPGHNYVSLASEIGMAKIESALAQHEANGIKITVLMLDNISTLFNVKANEEETWIGIQRWFTSLRSRGITIFFYHHAGKGGLSRSHSKSEDMLDVSIKLEAPDEQESGHLHSLMSFDKSRAGLSERPAEIKLHRTHSELCLCRNMENPLGCPGDGVEWEHISKVNKRDDAYQLFDQGATISDVASALGVPEGTSRTWRTKWGKLQQERAIARALSVPPKV